jgi:hypothetical protein
VRWTWTGGLDWRLPAGVLSVLAVGAGFVWYAGYRPGISATSLWLGFIVGSAALVAVLLSLSRSWWNVFGYVALVGLFGALFVRSQLRRGAFAPPVEEWTIAVGVLGGVIAVALLVRRSRQSHEIGPPGASRAVATTLAAVVLGASCVCVPAARFVGDSSPEGGGLLHSAPIMAEMLPAPPDMEIVQSGSFKVGGEDQHVFVIASSVIAGRPSLVEAIVAHYLLQDWPLEEKQIGRRKVFTGCRPVRGLVTWNQHCMEVIIDEGTDDRPGFPSVPGAVNVYIA